jgi:hypothetical protein
VSWYSPTIAPGRRAPAAPSGGVTVRPRDHRQIVPPADFAISRRCVGPLATSCNGTDPAEPQWLAQTAGRRSLGRVMPLTNTRRPKDQNCRCGQPLPLTGSSFCNEAAHTTAAHSRTRFV